MGKSNRKNSDISKSDERKKANRNERREAKRFLNEGVYEGFETKKKLRNYSTEWDD